MTSAKTFLPKASYMPWRGEYRPTYRWFSEANWTLVPGGKSYRTAMQAIDAAEEYLAGILNTRIESEQIAQETELSEIEKWRVKRAEQAAAEKLKVFGVRDWKGNKVAVEIRRARV